MPTSEDIRRVIKFDCDACAEAFPKTCPEHPRKVAPSSIVAACEARQSVHPQHEAREAPPFGRSLNKPLLEYAAPFEFLELEIRTTLRED